jgi:hypothetical protein
MLETKLALARRPTRPSALSPIAEVVASQAARRFVRGLDRADLLEDLRAGAHTAIVPIDRAFDALPWSFEALMNEDALVEARVDLFEYLIVRGLVPECEAATPYRTLHGAPIWIGPDAVFGGYGAARILRTSRTPMQVVHLVDRVVFASPPRTDLVGASPEMDATP